MNNNKQKICLCCKNAEENSETHVIVYRQDTRQHLERHVAEAFPPAKWGTILNNPQYTHYLESVEHTYQYLIGAKLRLSDLPNDDS